MLNGTLANRTMTKGYGIRKLGQTPERRCRQWHPNSLYSTELFLNMLYRFLEMMSIWFVFQLNQTLYMKIETLTVGEPTGIVAARSSRLL